MAPHGGKLGGALGVPVLLGPACRKHRGGVAPAQAATGVTRHQNSMLRRAAKTPSFSSKSWRRAATRMPCATCGTRSCVRIDGVTFGVTLGGLYKFRSKIVGPYLGLKQNILKSVRIDGVTFIRCAWNFVELCPEESLASKVKILSALDQEELFASMRWGSYGGSGEQSTKPIVRRWTFKL